MASSKSPSVEIEVDNRVVRVSNPDKVGREMILRVHLVPTLGSRKLNAITTETVQQLKVRLQNKAPKTVNNVLTVLSVS